MEEDQELRHLCKFCNKSFPCGRSLGGHMRSHLINSSSELDDKKVNKKKLKLPSPGNNGSKNGDQKKKKIGGDETSCLQNIGYSLREHPKKTSKFAKSSEEDTLLLSNKLCKECGKSFQTWKALFGHMKCHWNSANNHKLITDSQSDNEASAAPSRKKRSRRRIKRYMVANTSSYLSIADASPFDVVSDTEQEQEEVAMSLILLSMDVGESSGNNSEFLEAPLSNQSDQTTKAERKKARCNGGESIKLNNPKNGKFCSESSVLDTEKIEPELKGSDLPKNGSRMKISEVQTDEITETDNGNGVQGSAPESRKNLIKESGKDQPEFDSKKDNPRKRKTADQHDRKLSIDCLKVTNNISDAELCEGFEKKSKFECTACNKTFPSYQALGGHRASHKKIKGCFSKIDSSENSTETDLTPNQTADSKLIKCSSYDDMIDKFDIKFAEGYGSKQSKRHECPICFRVFPSGQALGGHKRAHIIAEAKSSSQSVVIQKSVPEVRDFLDLNLPPPVEDESSEHVGFQPWWIGSNHKHEQLVDLLSN